jgi:hypothetical protein
MEVKGERGDDKGKEKRKAKQKERALSSVIGGSKAWRGRKVQKRRKMTRLTILTSCFNSAIIHDKYHSSREAIVD